MLPFSILRPILHSLPPELAHAAAISALKSGMAPPVSAPKYSSLAQTVAGIAFANPVGLAAGFDKDAEAIDGLLAQGFGHVEIGTVTPNPQKGNPKPRLFRLSEDDGIVNRMGFPSCGAEIFHARLKARKAQGIVGANIAKNRNAGDTVADYVGLLRKLYHDADYIAVNVSSPNTQGLRALQEKRALKELLAALTGTRAMVADGEPLKPIFLKIAPDLTEEEQQDILDVAMLYKIDALIVTNTSVARPANLRSHHRAQTGGLSGRPLFEMSTQVLRNMYRLANGKMTFIGVGGVASGEDAWEKITAGASLVQLYSALIYQGFGLVTQINDYLAERLQKEGLKTIADAVGIFRE